MAMNAAHIDWIAARKAPNHCFDQSLFHRPRYLGLGEDVRGGLREMGCRSVQARQPRQGGWRRPDTMWEGGWCQFAPDDGLTESSELLERQ